MRYANGGVKYYAEELFDTMVGLGTNDHKLIRILVTRSEIDLDKIQDKYSQLYGRTLGSSIDVSTIYPVYI